MTISQADLARAIWMAKHLAGLPPETTPAEVRRIIREHWQRWEGLPLQEKGPSHDASRLYCMIAHLAAPKD